MNLEELIDEVDTFLSKHLDATFWSDLDEANRSSSFHMAQNDVEMATLVPLDKFTSLTMLHAYVGAVAEQAVYLARNYSSLNEGKVLTSESVEGINASYTLLKQDLTISPRASNYIKQIIKLKKSTPIRIIR